MRGISNTYQTRFQNPDYERCDDEEPLSYEEYHAITQRYPDILPSTETERADFYARQAMRQAA